MRKALLFFLILVVTAFLVLRFTDLAAASAPASSIVGQLNTPTGGAVVGGTLSFTLSQATVVSGTASIVPTTSACYTSALGTVVGIPDPLALPIVSTNTSTGTLAGGTYYTKLTYTGAGGQSLPSPETTTVLTGTGELIVNPPAIQPASATGYKVYIGTATGTETLQGTVVGFTQFTQSTPLANGAALPASNTSTCFLWFSDAMIPTGTFYTVNLVNQNGTQMAGYPQTWCTYGGASGVINVSTGAPTGNCGENGVFYPTPILANPINNALQSISGPVTINAPLVVKQLNGGSLYCDQYPGADASIKVNNCIAAVIAQGGGTADATGLYGSQPGLTEEIDVGNSSTSAALIQVNLVLPASAQWSWNITDGVSCGIKSFGSSSVYTNNNGGNGARMTLNPFSSSTNMRALYCTNFAAPLGGYMHAQGFTAADYQGATYAKGLMDIERTSDGSGFDDLSGNCSTGSLGAPVLYVSGLSFHSRIRHFVAEGSNYCPPVQIGDSVNTTDAGIIEGITANRPPVGTPNIEVSGSGGIEGLLIIDPYMEGNTSEPLNSAVPFIDLASTSYNTTIIGGTAQAISANSTRPVITSESKRITVNGMQAINTSGGIVDSVYNVTKPGVQLCCGNQFAIPNYDPITTSSFEVNSIDLTSQNAAIGTTTFYTVPAAFGGINGGQYRFSWDAKVTTPATTGAATSTLGALTIVYTDPDGVVQTITAAAQVAAGTIATTSTGNSTTTVLLGLPILLNAKANTNITYAFAYASNTAAQMNYNLHLKLDQQPQQ